MDNRKIDVTSEGVEALELAIRLMWPNAVGGKATHYKVMALAYFGKPTDGHSLACREVDGGTPTMLLLWGAEHRAAPLPYPLELAEAVQFIKGWLKNVEYGPKPDHDGDNGKGWRVFTEEWGQVADHQRAIVAVQPVWAMHGK